MNIKTIIVATLAAFSCAALPAMTFATSTETLATSSDMPACKGMKDCEDGKLCKGADNACKGGHKCSCHGTAGHHDHSTSENEISHGTQPAS